MKQKFHCCKSEADKTSLDFGLQRNLKVSIVLKVKNFAVASPIFLMRGKWIFEKILSEKNK